MNLAQKIDHTLLRAEADRCQIKKLVDEAVEHRFVGVCVNGCFVSDAANALRGTGVKTCAVAGFPLGAGKTVVQAKEAHEAVKDGAQEIDFVAHLPHLMACDLASSEAQWTQIVEAARSADPAVVVKVILESAVLLQDPVMGEARIRTACQAARASGCDFVKTSSGFHPAGGASVQAVSLMKKHAGGLGVKAAGGIRCYNHAIELIQAGADRLGCSVGVALVTAEADRAKVGRSG